MKKLFLLCLAPALLLSSCNKSQARQFKGAAEYNEYRVTSGNLQFDISSELGVDYVCIWFAIENEGTKNVSINFKNSYLKIEGEKQKYEIHFINSIYLKAKVPTDEVTVKADSSVSMIAETNDLGSATLEGRTVSFHTVINGQYEFIVSNLCEVIR